MNWLEPILGLLLILLAAGLMFFFSLPQKSTRRGQPRSRVVLRPIRAMQRLRRAIGLAVEDGSRLHVSIGGSSIISPTNASALVGLSTLERVGMLSSVVTAPRLRPAAMARWRSSSGYPAGCIPDRERPRAV